MKTKVSAIKFVCGIDVSGDTLDVCYQTAEGTFEWAKHSNNTEGFKQIWKLTGKAFHFVMEATGIYQLPFCFFLEAKKSTIQCAKCVADKAVHTNETGAQ